MSDRARGLSTVSVVVLALCLAVAIYGLVLFLIGGRGLDFYTFAFVSLLAMAVHFPRLAQWEEWAKDMAPALSRDQAPSPDGGEERFSAGT